MLSAWTHHGDNLRRGCDVERSRARAAQTRLGSVQTSRRTVTTGSVNQRENTRRYSSEVPGNSSGRPGEQHGYTRGHMETICSWKLGGGLKQSLTGEEAKWAARQTCSPRCWPPCCRCCSSVGSLSASTQATSAAGRAGELQRRVYVKIYVKFWFKNVCKKVWKWAEWRERESRGGRNEPKHTFYYEYHKVYQVY